MPLQEGRIVTRIVGGLDTKSDPKAAPPTRLLDLQNGVFSKAGTVSKRNGSIALGRQIEGGSGSTYATPRGLAVRDSELLLLTDTRAYSYRASADTWSDIGEIASMTATEAPLARTGTAQTAGDHAVNAGVMVTAWEDSRGGIWWAVLEATTGRFLRAPAQLDAAGVRPRCVAVGSVLHVYYATAALGRISLLVVNPSDPTASPVASPLVIDLTIANPSYDACPTTYNSDAPALMAWASPGGIRISYVHPSGALGSVSTSLPSAVTLADAEAASVTGAIAVAYEAATTSKASTYIGVAWSRASSASMRIYSRNLAALIQFGELDSGNTCARLSMAFQGALSASGASVVWVAGDVVGGVSRDAFVDVAYFDSSGLIAHTTQRSVGLASRMVADSADAVMFYTVHAVTHFPLTACLRVRGTSTAISLSCVARSLTGSAVGLPTSPMLPGFWTDASDPRVHATVMPYHVVLQDNPGTYAETGLMRVSIDADDDEAWQTAQLGRCLYLGGACQLQYDGARWAEAGFHLTADDLAAGVPATGTGLLSNNGVYSYVVVPSEVNAQGELDRGPASIPLVVTLGATDNEVTLTLPTIRLTARSHVRLDVYRSLDGDASRLFLCSSLNPSTSAGANRYIANDTAIDTVAFIDRMSDATLQTMPTIYTTGGVLSNDPPPSGRALAVGKNRLFFSDPADPDLLRYSQQRADLTGVELSDALAVRLDPNGGAVTGIAVLDDAVIVAKETALYMIAGPGPLPNPDADAASGFSDPALITADVGCARPVSMGVTPVGLMFQTAKGICLLGRDRQVSYVGSPVEAFNDQTVRKTISLPGRDQVLFVCDSGRSLLYDYFFQQWSTFTNYDGLSAAVVDETLYVLRGDGRVFKETLGSYVDDNAQVSLRIETAWYRFSDALQGFQHVWHLHALGTRKSAHQLVMQYAIDYVDHWSAPVVFDARVDDGTSYGDGAYGDGPYGGTPSSAYQWRWHLGQPCEAIRFRFYDMQDAGATGESFELTELLLTGGVMSNALRPFPAGRTG